MSFFPRSFCAAAADLNVPFSLLFLSQMYASSTTQTLSKSFSMFDAKYSEEMLLGNVAKTLAVLSVLRWMRSKKSTPAEAN